LKSNPYRKEDFKVRPEEGVAFGYMRETRKEREREEGRRCKKERTMRKKRKKKERKDG
jgi:hypothetical protein